MARWVDVAVKDFHFGLADSLAPKVRFKYCRRFIYPWHFHGASVVKYYYGVRIFHANLMY